MITFATANVIIIFEITKLLVIQLVKSREIIDL